MAATSIYMQLLGQDFALLEPTLQLVHGPAPRVHASGVVAVTYGTGPIVRLLNRIMDVPRASAATPLRLAIQRSPTRETWIRDFAGKPLRTTQWADNGLFIEAVGRTEMAMRLHIADGILRFDPVFTRFMGIKIPSWIAVSVRAEVMAQAQGWKILVETKSPILGLLFRYDGMIYLQA
jgi:hypothetical protein